MNLNQQFAPYGLNSGLWNVSHCGTQAGCQGSLELSVLTAPISPPCPPLEFSRYSRDTHCLCCACSPKPRNIFGDMNYIICDTFCKLFSMLLAWASLSVYLCANMCVCGGGGWGGGARKEDIKHLATLPFLGVSPTSLIL